MTQLMLFFLMDSFRYDCEGCSDLNQYLLKAYAEYLELCDEFNHNKMDLLSYLSSRE